MKTFKTLFTVATVAVVAGVVGFTSPADAASGPHKKPKEQSWSFAGPFGHWDLGQLQRGFKVYKEVCSSCHSMDLVAFRNLTEIGFSDAEIKTLAAEYEVQDGPNAEGEMYDRPAVLSDRWPSPWANNNEAAASNNGAVPPDFSLLAKARAPERGFPTFVFDIFTMYAENGPDYIYSMLTGYEDAPAGSEAAEGTHYNPYFIAGDYIAMANPLSDDIVDYDDGTAGTVDQYSKDVSAFMMWAAEPKLVERKALGFKVMIFLALLSLLLYLTKKSIFAGLGRPAAAAAGIATAGAAIAATKAAPVARVAAKAPAAPKAAPKAKPAPKPAPKAKPASKPAPKAKAAPKKAAKPAAKAKRTFTAKDKDDLKRIKGIGPQNEQRLNKEKIFAFEQIASWNKKDQAYWGEKLAFPGRIEREEWVKQAKVLAKGGVTQFAKRVDKGQVASSK